MSVLWSVLPLDCRTREWLDSLEIAYPGEKASQLPTSAQLSQAMLEVAGYKCEARTIKPGQPWEAFLESVSGKESGWTVLRIGEVALDLEPQEIYFTGGWEEAIRATMGALCNYCGPLVLYDTSSGEPQVIEA